MNSHFIARRIENSCDILGGQDRLESMGFHNVMGYVSIVKELNEMKVLEVFYIIETLMSMGKIYKKFAYHLVDENVLSDKFFEVDYEFNPTENNLNYLMKKSMYNESSESDKSLDSYYTEVEESKFEKIYNQLMAENNEDKTIEKLLNYEQNKKILDFSNKIDKNVLNWLNFNVKKMSYEEFANFITLINKIRENG